MTIIKQPSMTSEEDTVRAAARAWFVILLDKPTAKQQAEFDLWLQSDPKHYEAYRMVEANWHATENAGQRLAANDAEQLAVYLNAMDQTKKQKKTFKALSVLSLVLVAMLGGAIWLERPSLLQDMVADYTTLKAERRTIIMADGSKILLDADSALADEYTHDERRVKLLRGAAYFDVVPSDIPFIVAAADAEVRVLGTGFDVRLDEGGASVTLEHGRVAVTSDQQADATILEPGQQVRLNAGGTIGAVQPVELADALAWRDGRYIFYRARLADVVDEIARYRNGRILITSSALGDELVTGSFSLSDTDAALAALQSSVGFQINTIGNRLTILRQ